MAATTGERFERAVQIMARLRAPGGCPWDREQTFDSIKPYTVEETYEVLEAIDERDWDELAGELGDLLLQILFYSQLASEQGSFAIDDVLDRLAQKLIGRHPHVFGEVRADTAEQVVNNWEAIKREEKKQRPRASRRRPEEDGEEQSSLLEEVSRAMPPLLEAHKLGARAAKVGFDWPELSGLFEKLREETQELEAEVEAAGAPGRPREPMARERIEAELGDLFFVVVNLARRLEIDSDTALRAANRKFRRRFAWMEKRLALSGHAPAGRSADELENLWQAAKKAERERS